VLDTHSVRHAQDNTKALLQAFHVIRSCKFPELTGVKLQASGHPAKTIRVCVCVSLTAIPDEWLIATH